jgi:steroid delta-isomerase-like uncharacterized protein
MAKIWGSPRVCTKLLANEKNKALVRRYLEEVFNKENLAVIDEIDSPDYVAHLSGYPPLNREGLKETLTIFRAAFPDLRVTIEDLVAEGDKVVHRSTFNGTHRGNFQGIPATGKAFAITGMNISRISSGKIVEDWNLIDFLGLMQQIGVVPPPPVVVAPPSPPISTPTTTPPPPQPLGTPGPQPPPPPPVTPGQVNDRGRHQSSIRLG